MIYFQIDTVMLSLMRDATETGLYAAAYKLPIAAFIISHALSIATRPAMFEHANNEKDRLKNIYFLRAKYLMILGIFIGISVWFLRDHVVMFAFGSDFAGSAVVLGILAWFIPIRFVSIVSGDVVTTVGKQNIRTIIQGVTAALNIGLNVVLIPRYGLFGAAWATLCSEVFLLSSYTFFASRLFARLPTVETYIKPLLAGLVMCVILLIFKTHWLVSFIISAVIFWVSLVIFGTFKRDPLLRSIRTKLLRA
jgi:O-antigen/teichoic acid export membrane protein